jgi:hypothetical protein
MEFQRDAARFLRGSERGFLNAFNMAQDSAGDLSEKEGWTVCHLYH